MSFVYLPEAAADYSPQSGCSDGVPSATSNTLATRSESCKPGSETGCSTTRRSGTTLEHSTGDPGVDAWILSQRDFLASHSQQQENAAPMPTIETDGRTPFALSERSDPDSSYWKTCAVYLVPPAGMEPNTSEPFSETWPTAGMMLAGACYRLPKWERRIAEIGSGLWPTATVKNGAQTAENPTPGQTGGTTLLGAVRRSTSFPTPTAADSERTSKTYARGNQTLLGAALWPTPTSRDWRSGKASAATHARNSRPLNEAVTMWPTPRNNTGPSTDKKHLSLDGAVKMWPTPTAITKSGGAALTKWGGSGARETLKRKIPRAELNGLLNPTWVEWLMGWPLGWTALEPLETARFQEWLQQHGVS